MTCSCRASRPPPAPYFHTHVGLVETVIGCTVPSPSAALQAEDPLLLLAEPYGELPVARDALRAPAPAVSGLILAADHFDAYEARKLYLHNMSHAALAYLGICAGTSTSGSAWRIPMWRASAGRPCGKFARR